jgi:hypothetical protein
VHYLKDAAGLGGQVLIAIVAARLDRYLEMTGKLARSWRLRHGRPAFIYVPSVVRELPGGLGYRVPARFLDPFTGQPFPAAG